MDEVVVRTDINVPPAEAFAFLRDFPGYAAYSEYLERVDQHGDGGEGTVYELEAVWWRLRYTARTEVTKIDAPERIEWRVEEAITAEGSWDVSPIERDGSAEPASRVTLRMRYDPDTADAGVVKLPRFVSLSWVIERVRPLVEQEAEATVERVVADLEGEARPVDLEIETRHT